MSKEVISTYPTANSENDREILINWWFEHKEFIEFFDNFPFNPQQYAVDFVKNKFEDPTFQEEMRFIKVKKWEEIKDDSEATVNGILADVQDPSVLNNIINDNNRFTISTPGQIDRLWQIYQDSKTNSETRIIDIKEIIQKTNSRSCELDKAVDGLPKSESVEVGAKEAEEEEGSAAACPKDLKKLKNVAKSLPNPEVIKIGVRERIIRNIHTYDKGREKPDIYEPHPVYGDEFPIYKGNRLQAKPKVSGGDFPVFEQQTDDELRLMTKLFYLGKKYDGRKDECYTTDDELEEYIKSRIYLSVENAELVASKAQ